MSLVILFGSQTGTAEEVSYDLGRSAAQKGIPVQVCSLNKYPLEQLPLQKFVVFVVSTTGQGQPPDNMCGFWKAILNSALPSDLFEGVQYSVFGLGDSSYEEFNVVARKLWIRMGKLGAVPLCRKGLGDDMHDFEYEAEYHPWCQVLWEALSKHFTFTQCEVPPMWEVQVSSEPQTQLSRAPSLKVLSTQQVAFEYSETWKLQIQGSFSYQPGDVLCVYPLNKQKLVESTLEIMDWENTNLKIIPNKNHPFPPDPEFPESISLKDLLTYYLDLQKPPTRYFISLLAKYAKGIYKEKLEEMSAPTVDGRNEYHRYVTKERRNVPEVLWDFQSPQIPLGYFIEAAGLLRPRSFSIASPPSQTQIDLFISPITYNTPFGRVVEGLCSHYLTKSQECIFGFVKKGDMPLVPENKPLLMICTGAGVAPFRSLIGHRVHRGCRNNTLVYGCRHPDYDFLCKDELEALEASGYISVLPAFSRTQEKKYYVYQKLKDSWEFISQQLLDGAYVFVCSSYQNLPKFVKESLTQVLLKAGLTQEQVSVFMKDLIKTRFYAEAW